MSKKLDAKTILLLGAIIVIGLVTIYFVAIKPVYSNEEHVAQENVSVSVDLPDAKPVEVMGKGTNSVLPDELVAPDEEVADLFELHREQLAHSGDIDPRYDVSLTNNQSDEEKMIRIMELNAQYAQSSSNLAYELAIDEERAKQQELMDEIATYKELYEQSVADNNELASRVTSAEDKWAEEEARQRAKASQGPKFLQVTKKRGGVVSMLSSDGAEESTFYGDGVPGQLEPADRNALRASIPKTITVRNGEILPIRLSEDAYIDGVTLTAGTVVNGIVSIGSGSNVNRVNVHINSIEYQGRIMRVNLVVYDLDAQEGINVPDGDLAQSVNDLSTSLGQGISQSATMAGSSYTINRSAKDAVVGQVSRGVIAGIGNMLGSAKRDPRITIKAGYKVYLMNGN